ncbi:hypothetical protein GCM10010238_61640 [Streptomyces griseoviridis]|uniref:Uncharacterized protein n=1 Tax=Streptomyces griseoviridis TaxID=45398 RepID=A0A918GU83_STRGD|nr:hypothetical protein GCM10010238_61640 [Streptomyces niveoruber]
MNGPAMKTGGGAVPALRPLNRRKTRMQALDHLRKLDSSAGRRRTSSPAGTGGRLLDVLRNAHHAWVTFTHGFQYEQDPSNQGRLGRQPAGLGVLPGQGNLA